MFHIIVCLHMSPTYQGGQIGCVALFQEEERDGDESGPCQRSVQEETASARVPHRTGATTTTNTTTPARSERGEGNGAIRGDILSGHTSDIRICGTWTCGHVGIY